MSFKFDYFDLFEIGVMVVFLMNFAPIANAQPSTASNSSSSDQPDTLAREIERLQKEQQLFEEKLKKELRKLQAEQKKLHEEYDLMMQKQKNRLADIQKKKRKLKQKLELKQQKHQSALNEEKQAIEELETKLKLSKTRSDSILQDLKTQQEKLSTEYALKEAEWKNQLSEMRYKVKKKKLEQELESTKSKLKEARLNNKKMENQIELAKLRFEQEKMNTDIQLRETRSQWKQKLNTPIEYESDPLVGKTLYITDRRIKLNGPIISGTGEWISKRIHYFNNQSEQYPIFIVIDDSPGGSVMEGFRIMKAMRSSEAPVHVVVKERAFSMAAAITALADRSFVFPDAVIMHHELRASMGGSLTETEEGLEMMKKWWERLASPIAEKMGMSLKEFREKLYEENSNGNWQEFGTEAVDLNWVDRTVNNIKEAGIREEPDDSPPTPRIFFLKKDSKQLNKDSQGRFYRKLPPLRPYDFYFMYNPNDFYRW